MTDREAAWDDLSYEKQKKYLDRHPGSKRKLTKSPEGTKPTEHETKSPNWQELERKVVDKAKKMEHPAPKPINAFDPHEIGKRMDSFDPFSGEQSIFGRSYRGQRDQADVMNGEVTVAFRDLGRWHTPEDVSAEDAEDYDWQEWAPGEHQKYMGKFQSWLNGQKWFDPKVMEPFLHTGEKNWVYFGIRPKSRVGEQ